MNESVAKAMCDAKVVKFGDFTYVSGKRGPVYVDVRVLPSNPASMDTVTSEMADVAKKIDFDVVCGAETAGISLAAVVAIKLKKPMVYVRKKPKQHGTKTMIEGSFREGDRMLLVDDMITDGGSKRVFIDGIRASGAIVEDALIVLDREQGGSETLSKSDVRLHSLITLKELLDYMKDKKLVKEEKYKEVVSYLEGQ
ncbi:MAG: orotate phosphoribosyltransferase [Candidatus Altiarchaeota archaeon]